MIEIAPSILSADFARLGEDIAKVERGGARLLHVDVMDGHFVPNITLGPPVVKSLRKITKMQLDVHLMISDPDRYAGAFIEAGADLVSVHQEACPHLDRTLHMIRDRGALAGVVLNPSTPVATLDDVLDVVDFVLIMSVNPGFGGQKFIPRALDKVRALAAARRQRGLGFKIEIDGGVTLDNMAAIIGAGCDWLVAGATVFGCEDPAQRVADMRRIAEEVSTVRV
jgi:ribulose-phosphate 3-epimerase